MLRPADANETAAAWRAAVQRPGPTAIVLSRQGLPVLDPDTAADKVSPGAYVVHEPEAAQTDVVLIATGSEVRLALWSAEELESRDIRTRVVSIPSWEFFREQPAELS